MVDLTFIKANAGQVLVRDTNLVYQYSNLSNAWATAGVVNENIESSFGGLSGLVSKYDSTFNSLQSSLIASLALTANDSAGNTITWVASSDNALVTVTGASPVFSFMPRKELGDDEKSAKISFVGTINGGDSAPKFRHINVQQPVDSGFTADSLGITQPNLTSLDLAFSYNWQKAALLEYNHEAAVDVSTFFIPNIQYSVKIKPGGTQAVSYKDMKFENGGKLVFVLEALSKKVLSYVLETAYAIETLITTSEKSLYLNNDQVLQFTNAQGIELSPNGKKLFLVDFSKNKIAEFILNTPLDLHSAVLKENYVNHSTFFEKEDALMSPDGRYYYTMDIPARATNPETYRAGYPTGLGGTIRQYDLHDPGEIYSLKINDSNGAIPGYVSKSCGLASNKLYLQYRQRRDGIANGWNQSGAYLYSYKYFYTNPPVWYRYNWRYVTFWYHVGMPQAFCFNYDGTAFYIAISPATSYGEIRKFTMSTPWDVTTTGSSFTKIQHGMGVMTTTDVCAPSQTFGMDATSSSGYLLRHPHSIHSMKLSVDGMKLYVYDKTSNQIMQYGLSTQDDITNSSIGASCIKPMAKTFDPGGYDFRIDLANLDSANSIIGQDYPNINSITLIDDSQPRSILASSKNYIHKFNRTLSGDLIGTVVSSTADSSLYGQDVTAVNSIYGNKLFVQSRAGYQTLANVTQVNMDTYNDLSTLTPPHTTKINDVRAVPYDSSQQLGPSGLLIDSGNSELFIGGSNKNEIYRYGFTTDSGVSGMSYKNNLNIDSIGSITGMSFADSSGMMHVTSVNKIHTIQLTDSFDNSNILSAETYQIAAPVFDRVTGIEWTPDGKNFIVSASAANGQTDTILEKFSTKNSFKVIT